MRKILAFLFLVAVVGSAAWLVVSRERAGCAEAAPPSAATPGDLHEALWYEKLAGGLVRCMLCPHSCRLPEGRIGRCRVRQNVGGKLYSLSYGRLATAHVDPIEKKPFFHVLPGSRAYSIATPGCNLRCLFCQNWEISQMYPWEVRTSKASPEQVVAEALRSGAESIAFTYSEPTIFYEYMLDIAKLAQAKGLKTLVVSAGYIQPEPLQALLPHIDAYKVDFKAFNPEFYTELTGGSRDPVLQAMKTIRASGVWLEVVNLLVTGQNDGEEEVRQLARWVRENLGDDVPLHFSRFHPMHKLANLPPTPIERVIRAREIAIEEGLKNVYTGNIPAAEGDSTYSPTTGEIVIERKGYYVVRNHLTNGLAPDGEKIPGIWR
ncbi:MAG TPA: AmmeMemoRadiSam system radical SAM enzyme [Verrucomicrobia bacterium]|nr:AmmeMemoRadiSam system radical SAM enzyme [Verrucomicrobiota bacterium]